MAVVDIEALDFTFRAPDPDGAMCRYEALFSFVDDASGRVFLVYADEQPGQDGEVATYASLACEPEALQAAQAAVDAGARPKKPPVVALEEFEDEADWKLVDEALDLVEQEEED